MRTIPIKTQTVNMSTGKVISEDVTPFGILPPLPGLCQICGRAHEAEEPHDNQQLYYQYAFYGANGRWPTWADAIAHCTPALQALWRERLAKHWSEPPEGVAPIAHLGPEPK